MLKYFLSISLLVASLYAGEQGFVLDVSKQIEWQDNEEHNEMKYKLAEGYCKQLRLNGFDDWRLPTKEELVALSNNNALKKKFIYLQEALYWSSSLDKAYPLLNAYTVYSGNAHTALSDKCEDYYVICVRKH